MGHIFYYAKYTSRAYKTNTSLCILALSLESSILLSKKFMTEFTKYNFTFGNFRVSGDDHEEEYRLEYDAV